MTGVLSRLTRHRRRIVPALSMLTTMSLAVRLLSAAGVPGPAGGPAAAAQRPVPVHAVARRTVKIPPMPAAHRAPVSWPAARSGTAAFTAGAPAAAAASRKTARKKTGNAQAGNTQAGPTAGSARAGSLPVWAGPPAGTGPVIAARAPRAGLGPPVQGKGATRAR